MGGKTWVKKGYKAGVQKSRRGLGQIIKGLQGHGWNFTGATEAIQRLKEGIIMIRLAFLRGDGLPREKLIGGNDCKSKQ